MKLLNKKLLLACTVALVMTVQMAAAVQSETNDVPIRIMVFPFTIHGPEDLAYLSTAAREMLATRLTKPGRIEVVRGEASVSDRSAAMKQAMGKSAELMVLGNLSFFGNEVSVDAGIFKAGQMPPLRVFHDFGRTDDGILIYIQKLADNIRKDILGESAGQSEKPAPSTARQPIDTEVDSWRSKALDMGILGIGIGDVTGDGRNELVAADKNRVYIFGLSDGQLIQLYEITQPKNIKILSLDVADLNANERAEIFVTRMLKNGRLSSAVYEWHGDGFEPIAHNLKWFFRAQNHPENEGKKMLMGQKQGSLRGVAADLGSKGLFAPGIFRLDWQDRMLVVREELDLPEETNIYGFVYGDLMGGNSHQVLRYTRRDHIQLLEKDGTEAWRSSEPYGGGTVYLEAEKGMDPNEKSRHYLSQRMVLTCSKNEPQCRAVLTRNKDSGKRYFKRYRKFAEGHLEILAWDGTRLQTVWQTVQYSGHISDFTLADMDHDGLKELVFSLVSGSGSFTQSQSSRIYILSLP